MTVQFPQIVNFSDLPPPLAPDQLHVMVTSLNSLEKYRERCFAVISSEETRRAERFINPTHGDNFRLIRGTLRTCIASYLQLPAEDIQFVFNQYGKPEIESAQNHLRLQFNLSHSHNRAAFVFTMGKSVGIDIEFMKPLRNLTGLAQHVFSPLELEEFNSLENAQRRSAFFRLWTRKEAFIKAKGQGLSMGLRSIYIGLDETVSVNRIQYRADWLSNWLVKDLRSDQDYKLAVAVET